MTVDAKLRARILRLADKGKSAVEITCVLLCDWRAVDQVLGERAAAAAADHANPAAEGGGASPACGSSQKGSLLSDPGAGRRPMRAARPTHSHAKPEEAVSAAVETASAGATAPRRAARLGAAAVRAPADDAGSRASGGAGAAAPFEPQAKARVDADGVPDQAQAPAAERVSRPAGGRTPAATSERMDATSPGGEQPGTPSSATRSEAAGRRPVSTPLEAGENSRGRATDDGSAGNGGRKAWMTSSLQDGLKMSTKGSAHRGPAQEIPARTSRDTDVTAGRDRHPNQSPSAARAYNRAGGAGAAADGPVPAETGPSDPTPQPARRGGGRAGSLSPLGRDLPEDRLRVASSSFPHLRGRITDPLPPPHGAEGGRRGKAEFASIYQGRRYDDPRTWGRRARPETPA